MTYEIYSKDDNDIERNYSTPKALRKWVTSPTMVEYFDSCDGSLEVQILHKPTGAVGNFCLGDCKDFDRYIQPFIEECEVKSSCQELKKRIEEELEQHKKQIKKLLDSDAIQSKINQSISKTLANILDTMKLLKIAKE